MNLGTKVMCLGWEGTRRVQGAFSEGKVRAQRKEEGVFRQRALIVGVVSGEKQGLLEGRRGYGVHG